MSDLHGALVDAFFRVEQLRLRVDSLEASVRWLDQKKSWDLRLPFELSALESQLSTKFAESLRLGRQFSKNLDVAYSRSLRPLDGPVSPLSFEAQLAQFKQACQQMVEFIATYLSADAVYVQNALQSASHLKVFPSWYRFKKVRGIAMDFHD